MKRAYSNSILAAVSVALLSFASACEVNSTDKGYSLESLVRYLPPENPAPVTEPWADGQNVTINGLHGRIRTLQGASDEVKVQFGPFNIRSHEEEDDARREMDEELFTKVESTADGVVVTVSRADGSHNGLGATIDVYLPDNFNGELSISNKNSPVSKGNSSGDVVLEYVGQGTRIGIANKSLLGECTVNGAPSVKITEISCKDEVSVRGVADSVAIVVDDAFAGATVSLVEVGAGVAGSEITTDGGDIDLSLPASSPFFVEATTTDGTINLGDPPADCKVAGNKADCQGGGSVFKLTTDDGDITLNYL